MVCESQLALTIVKASQLTNYQSDAQITPPILASIEGNRYLSHTNPHDNVVLTETPIMTDQRFLAWLHERLEHVHRENPDLDYMNKLRAIIRVIPQDQVTPNTTNVPLTETPNGKADPINR